ncbi:Hypothetical protein CAP_5273 [Chondromyces apiculatus DSM 436]|uniref:Uncharacterized protein n=1 Tax=Chondromyces apiculatus DSM 436 TaxID=1192034 RepID=A0A017T3V3_9BACT|nr:Hypothetical protein CAP_5273 [Chondromyces apiculatus DSM 436]
MVVALLASATAPVAHRGVGDHGGSAVVGARSVPQGGQGAIARDLAAPARLTSAAR